jgi:hypothetical protein
MPLPWSEASVRRLCLAGASPCRHDRRLVGCSALLVQMSTSEDARDRGDAVGTSPTTGYLATGEISSVNGRSRRGQLGLISEGHPVSDSSERKMNFSFSRNVNKC